MYQHSFNNVPLVMSQIGRANPNLQFRDVAYALSLNIVEGVSGDHPYSTNSRMLVDDRPV